MFSVSFFLYIRGKEKAPIGGEASVLWSSEVEPKQKTQVV